MLGQSFTATITKDEVNSGWTCVIWPESSQVLGTRKAVKVIASIEGHDFQATFLPMGDGSHLLPLNAATMKRIQKQKGDRVEVEIKERL